MPKHSPAARLSPGRESGDAEPMKIVKGPLANACFMKAAQRNSSFPC
jgi:hypothetical protein